MKKKNLNLISIFLALVLTLSACGQTADEETVTELSFPEDSSYNYVELDRLPQTEDVDIYLADQFPSHEFTYIGYRDLRDEESYVDIYSPEFMWTYGSEFGEVEVYGFASALTNEDAYVVNFLNNVNTIMAQELDLEGLFVDEENAYEIPALRRFVDSREEVPTVVEASLAEINEAREQIPDIDINLEIFSRVEGIEDFAYFAGLYDSDSSETDIIRSINDHRIRFAFSNRLMLDEYSENELAGLHLDSSRNNYKFRVYRFVEKDSEVFQWEDLADDGLSKSSISMGTLYEILNRINYESLEGNESDFTFTGVDESEYQFSLEFRQDSEFENYEMLGSQFYYLKDGERVNYIEGEMTSLEYETIEDMTDLFVRKFWVNTEAAE